MLGLELGFSFWLPSSCKLLCHFSVRCDHIILFVLKCRSLNRQCIENQDETTADIAGSSQKTSLLPSRETAHSSPDDIRGTGQNRATLVFLEFFGIDSYFWLSRDVKNVAMKTRWSGQGLPASGSRERSRCSQSPHLLRVGSLVAKWITTETVRSQPVPCKCYLIHSNIWFPPKPEHSGKCYYTTTKKNKFPGVGVWHKKTSSHCLEASSETCKAPAPENNTVAQALLGEQLIPLFLVTPQGFGYQTFLDWRACPGHTAHQPGECDRCGLGLWVYRSLPLCSGECHTAGPRHLAVHQQAPGKPLCISSAGEWPGSCSQPALSRSWTSGLFIPDFSFYPLSIQAWPCHHFSSSFRVLTFSGKKSQLSAAFPVQNKPIVCLGSSQIHIHWTVFCWEILSRKLEGVRFEAIIYLLWASDRLPTMWKYLHVSHSVRAKRSWTRLLQSWWWILVLTSYM